MGGHKHFDESKNVLKAINNIQPAAAAPNRVQLAREIVHIWKEQPHFVPKKYNTAIMDDDDDHGGSI